MTAFLTADRADERGCAEIIQNVRRVQNLTQRLKAPRRAGWYWTKASYARGLDPGVFAFESERTGAFRISRGRPWHPWSKSVFRGAVGTIHVICGWFGLQGQGSRGAGLHLSLNVPTIKQP